MRELISHKVNGLNEAIKIVVLDEPGHGNANHQYAIEYPAQPEAPGFREAETGNWKNACVVKFQKGPIAEAGLNGISNEALLAIVEDRLAGFQSGNYANHWNAMALESVRGAMGFLHERTKERVARGVEGTHQK